MVPWGLVSAGDGFIIRVHKEFFFILFSSKQVFLLSLQLLYVALWLPATKERIPS